MRRWGGRQERGEKQKEGRTKEKFPENYTSKSQYVKELHIDPRDVHFSN